MDRSSPEPRNWNDSISDEPDVKFQQNEDPSGGSAGKASIVSRAIVDKENIFFSELKLFTAREAGRPETLKGLPFTSTARAGGGFNIDNMTGLTGGAQWQMLSSATTLIPTVSGTGTAGVISSTNTGAATNVIVLSGVYRA